MEPYRTETVETEAGEYTVELYYDSDVENPLTDWDHPGMAFYVDYSDSRYITTDTLADAGEAGHIFKTLHENYEYLKRERGGEDAIARRFAKWAAITGSPWILVEGSDSSSQSDYYRWYVLVNRDEFQGYALDGELSDIATSVMGTYRKWAAGEFTGYIVKAPDGDEIEDGSLWGIDDEDYAMQEGVQQALWDAAERAKKANLVGAGFVGLI